jgi:hypothetical protein
LSPSGSSGNAGEKCSGGFTESQKLDVVGSGRVTHRWKGNLALVPTPSKSRRSVEKWPSRSFCGFYFLHIFSCIISSIGLFSHADCVRCACTRCCHCSAGTTGVIWMWIAPLVVVAGSAVIINLWLGGSSPQPTMSRNMARVEDRMLARPKKISLIFSNKN